MRTIVASLMYERSPETLSELDFLVPDIYFLPDGRKVPAARGYVIKTHQSLKIDSGCSVAYRRAIYIIRHPYDVLLSHYRWSNRISGYSDGIEQYAKDWFTGRIFPGSWREHVLSWLDDGGKRIGLDLIVIRYEDLISNPVNEIHRVASYLGKPITLNEAERIAKETDPKAMSIREKRNNRPDLNVEGFDFIGPARAGTWREQLPESVRKSGRIYLGRVAKQFEYDLV